MNDLLNKFVILILLCTLFYVLGQKVMSPTEVTKTNENIADQTPVYENQTQNEPEKKVVKKKSNPKNNDKNNCMYYYKNEDFNNAVLCFKRAFKKNNENLKYHYYLAKILLDEKKYVASAYHASFVLKYRNDDIPEEYSTGASNVLNKAKMEIHRRVDEFDNSSNYLGNMHHLWFWEKETFNVWYEPNQYVEIDYLYPLNIWEKALDNLVRFNLVQNEQDADIKVYFSSDTRNICADANRQLQDRIGGCTKLGGRYNILENVPIYIYSYNNLDENREQIKQMKISLVHEFGHAMGLDSHSSDKADIMFYASAKTVPSHRDINTIKMLFSRY